MKLLCFIITILFIIFIENNYKIKKKIILKKSSFNCIALLMKIASH